MKKLFFLLLLVAGSFSAQAQIMDSLPWFKLERVVLQLEDRIGDISSNQLQAMQSSVNPIKHRAQGQPLTQQLRQRMRMEVRKAIAAELTPAQLNRLKATRKGGQDALDQALSGEKPIRKQQR